MNRSPGKACDQCQTRENVKRVPSAGNRAQAIVLGQPHDWLKEQHVCTDWLSRFREPSEAVTVLGKLRITTVITF